MIHLPLNPRPSVLLLLIASSLLSSSTAFATLNPSTTLELKYFDIRGVAEPSRILLALAGQTYTDTRYKITPGTFDAPEFTAAKEAGDLDMNMKRAPVLIVGSSDGGATTTVIGQSKSIERYLSKQLGFMGSTEEDAAQIDCIAEHCRDIKDAQMRKGFSAFNRDKTPEEKETARNEWFGSELPVFLEKLERSVALTCGDEGCHAVGESLSYADVVIFCLLKDCMAVDKEDMVAASVKCKVLNKIAESVAEHPNMVAYLKERPESMF